MKKFLVIVLSMFSVLSLSACILNSPEENVEELDVEELKELIEEGIENKDNIISNIELISDIEFHDLEIDIDWSSSNTDIIKNDGYVIRPEIGNSDGNVTLTATGALNEEEFTVGIDVVVKAYVVYETNISISTRFEELFEQKVLVEDRSEATIINALFDTEYEVKIENNEIVSVGNRIGSETCDSSWILNINDEEFTGNLETLILNDTDSYDIYLEVNEECFVTLELVDGFSVQTDLKLPLSGFGAVRDDEGVITSGGETGWPIIMRNNDQLQVGCNAEGYPREIDYDCAWYAPSLGYSIRAMYGIPSSWMGSYLMFTVNGTFGNWGISSQPFAHGDVFNISWVTFGDDYQELLDEFYPNGFNPASKFDILNSII